MKEFFLILFFGKVILLTPVPVNLEGSVVLEPDKPLTAITSGANLRIDVSSLATKKPKEGILEFKKRIKRLFPAGTIEARLVRANGKEVLLSYLGYFSFNTESTHLLLVSESGVPVDVKFVKVVIKSKLKLNGIKVFWKNFKH